GLQLLATLPESAVRDRMELDLLIAFGPPLFAAFGYASEEVVIASERAAKLSERLGDLDRLMSTLESLFLRHMVAGETKTPFDVAKQSIKIARTSGNLEHSRFAHRAMGSVEMLMGRLCSARTNFNKCIALSESEPRAPSFRHITDPGVVSLAYQALVLWMMGYPSQAGAVARQAIDRADALDVAFTRAQVRTIVSVLCTANGDADMLARLSRQTIALAAEHRMPTWEGYGTLTQGWALAETGNLVEGFRQLSLGMEMLDELNTTFLRTRSLAMYA